MKPSLEHRGGHPVRRIDGSYLYDIGTQIGPLKELSAYDTPVSRATTIGEARRMAFIAEAALDGLLNRSVFNLWTSRPSGLQLLDTIRQMKANTDSAPDWNQPMTWAEIYPVTSALAKFENVLSAELGLKPLYVVLQKAGFDTAILIEAGAACFPADVLTKAPDAGPDLAQATRCIAFELFTGAGFHLHRANEAVLHRYWDAVTNGTQRPASRNMGDYLNEMNQNNWGDPKVRAALKDLKDLHRNPLIHPEHSLETADEAIALMSSIHSVMVHMLKEIPIVAAGPTQLPAGAASPPQQTSTSVVAASAAQLP
jgi:hypothetical protein